MANKNTNRNASGAKAKNTAKKSEQAKVPDITVRIDRLIDDEETNIKAYASVNVGGAFAVHGLKVIDSKNGLFVNMPSRPFKDENGVTRYADLTERTMSSNVNICGGVARFSRQI